LRFAAAVAATKEDAGETDDQDHEESDASSGHGHASR
jgi:hypothetical protein